MSFINNLTDYESAYSGNILSANATTNFFSNYDRNRTVQAIDSITIHNISEEIKSLQNIKQLFLGKNTQKTFYEKQVAEEEKIRNEIIESLDDLRSVLNKVRAIYTNNSRSNDIEQTKVNLDEYNERIKKEEELISYYEKKQKHFLEESDKNLGKLKSEKGQLEEELSVLYDFMLTSAKDIIPEDKREAHICPICIEKKINICLTPCGHTFCDGCAQKSGTCALCRKQVKERVKMFISL